MATFVKGSRWSHWPSTVTVLTVLMATSLGAPSCSSGGPTCKSSGQFEERIQPLFEADQPNTCGQCHLSGVDLGMFARSSPCESMACLIENKLVDLDAPEKSKVLSFIGQAEPDSDLITDEVIQQEHDAFLEWIELEAKCRECSHSRCGDADAPFCESAGEPGEYDPADDPGDCQDKTLEQLFLDTVYASRGRCSPCHFEKKEDPFGLNPPPPKWIHQSGSCEAASLATLRHVERAGYINVDDPSKSLLILKPLSVDDGGLEHGGADKFHASDDPVYLNILYFVERYAECKNGD